SVGQECDPNGWHGVEVSCELPGVVVELLIVRFALDEQGGFVVLADRVVDLLELHCAFSCVVRCELGLDLSRVENIVPEQLKQWDHQGLLRRFFPLDVWKSGSDLLNVPIQIVWEGQLFYFSSSAPYPNLRRSPIGSRAKLWMP